ncbi:ubiquitin-protein transferase activating protein [Tulasnella sp. 418]|nr:ubiquitin-protein transferase activating protein [Tulasnella sp. 418]
MSAVQGNYEAESSDEEGIKSPSKRPRRDSYVTPIKRARHSLALRVQSLDGKARSTVFGRNNHDLPEPVERLISNHPLNLALSPSKLVPILKATPRTTRLSHAFGLTNDHPRPQKSLIETLMQGYSPSLVHKSHHCTTMTSASNLRQGMYLCLDAPDLRNNFYDNILSWSHQNVLAAGLNRRVFTVRMDDADFRTVNQLYECPRRNWIESVTWANADGPAKCVAVGLDSQIVEVLDANCNGKVVQRLDSQANPGGYAGEMSWNGHILAAGLEGVIKLFDVRKSGACVEEIQAHRATARVCGLKWRSDGILLASGGEDNSVNCWDARYIKKLKIGRSGKHEPLHQWIQHGCVKALSWCPWQRNILATGGGNCDGRIYFRSALSGETQATIPLQTQITSLHFSPHCKEILSTNGYYIPSRSANLRPRLPIPAPGIHHTSRLHPGHPLQNMPGHPPRNLVSRPAHFDHSFYFSSQPGFMASWEWGGKGEKMESLTYITRSNARKVHTGRSKAPLFPPDSTPAPRASIMTHRYPSLERVACIPYAHPDRVTLSALSPDGTSLCTTGSDQCLKFWRVWNPNQRSTTDSDGLDSLANGIIR